MIREAKRIGFSDEQIAKCQNTDESTIRAYRKNANIIPVVKQIDTLAAEWPAKTNYLYLTYGGDEDDIELQQRHKQSHRFGRRRLPNRLKRRVRLVRRQHDLGA